MNIINSDLKLYRGDDIIISDNILIGQPTINEICDFGEERFLKTVSQIVAVPQNSIYMLHKLGIDFTKITDFELFIIIRSALEYEDTKIILPNLDFSKSKVAMIKKKTSKGTVLDTEEPAVIFNNGAVINEKTYNQMASGIRRIARIQRPWFLTVGNESTKKRMINSAINEYETRKNKPFKSQFVPLVSSLSLSGYRDSVWDMKLYEFFDLIERLQLKEHANHLYEGIYNNCIKYEKVKKDLNWIREIEFNEFDKSTNISIET